VFLSLSVDFEAAGEHEYSDDTYDYNNEQGKRSPVISDPMFAKYFISSYIAYDSNELSSVGRFTYLMHELYLSPIYLFHCS
jgi:hypothetical protein